MLKTIVIFNFEIQLQGKTVVYKIISLIVGSAAVVILGIFAIYGLESGQPNSQINTFLDASWWTVATVTTVGYGDVVPVTDAGRILAIFYMFFGVSVLAVSLSVFATRYYKKRFEDDKEISHAQKMILDKIEQLENSQEKLQSELRDLVYSLKNLQKDLEKQK